MIDSDEMTKMLVEITTGQKPSRTDPEALDLWNQLKKECDDIEARGDKVDIPAEIPGVEA